VRNDEIATLRTSLVRLCDGNFCAALILDDFYYRAYANDIYRTSQENKVGYDRSLTTHFDTLQAMMSGMFGYNDIQLALSILARKKYTTIEVEQNDYITYEVHHKKINQDLEALPSNQRKPEPEQSIKPVPVPPPVIETLPKTSNPTRREARAVKFHNNRASAVALPATLTLQQWQKTLKEFNYKCAYCQTNEYQVLEHYIPLNFGGGTTAYNCVPACVSCNGTKSDQHPSMITASAKFIEALKRVQAYLETRRCEDL
jgi:5-methylcytosine-specific restriction endonuclease McrA